MKSYRRLPGVARVAALAVATALLTAGSSGCDKRITEADKTTPRAKTQPAATQPATTLPADATLASADDAEIGIAPETKPVEPLPVLSFVTIDGLGAEFPPTKLLLHEDDGKVRVELFSDLPKSAIKDYDGNELYFEMELAGGEGPQKVDGASWRYKSTSSDRADSANGIFLNGQRRHLQPDDVLVRFERRGEQLVAHVMGKFRAYEPGTPDALAPFAAVRGEVPVEVVGKR